MNCWRPELIEDHLDPHLSSWDLHRNLDLDAMPDTRTVLAPHPEGTYRKVPRWRGPSAFASVLRPAAM